jgi:hypothetical protein
VNGKTNWKDVFEQRKEQQLEKTKKFFDTFVNELSKIDENGTAKEYDKEYIKRMKRFANENFGKQADEYLSDLGVTYNNGINDVTPLPLYLVKKNIPKALNAIGDECYEPDGYFKKLNFIYKYCEDNIGIDHDDKCVWLSREDIKALINRCECVLEDNSRAETLLPTRSGFLFGSTAYDSNYFEQVSEVQKTMTTLLNKMRSKEDELFIWFNF